MRCKCSKMKCDYKKNLSLQFQLQVSSQQDKLALNGRTLYENLDYLHSSKHLVLSID